MKAQAIRHALTLLNVLLVLGGLAGGAWYVLKVRPAQADDPKRTAWVKQAMDAYQVAARNAAPAVVYPVSDKDLEAITRPDLTLTEKGAPGVWPFVGPVPPPPKPKVDRPKEPPKPTGLDALGRVLMVADYGPDPRSTMVFEFAASKHRRAFAPGDRIEDQGDKPDGEPVRAVSPEARTPGLYLVSIERVSPASADEPPRFRIAYDVVPEGVSAAQRQEVTLTLRQEASKGPEVIRPGAGAAASGAGRGTTVAGAGQPAAPALPPNQPPPLEQVHFSVERTSDDARRVDFDEAGYQYVRYSDPDRLLSDVRTEDARDAKGEPKGVRLVNVDPGSFASKFDVRPGDILKSINGRPVRSRAEAIDVVKGLPKDIASVAVVIERDGRDILYNVDPRDPRTRAAAGKVKFR